MFGKQINHQKIVYVGIMLAVLVLILASAAAAKIPEPDNIIYGVAGSDVVTVTLAVNGQPIVAYTMGDNPDAGEFYVLRVPMDALEPAEPGAAHAGDEAQLFIDDETAPAATLVIGERGNIYRHDIVLTDIDGDGLPDDWESNWFGDLTRNAGSHSDSDHLPDLAEFENGTSPTASDSDGDGVNDYTELFSGTDPKDSDEYLTSSMNLKKGMNLVTITADLTDRPDLKEWLTILGDSTEIEKVMVHMGQTGDFSTLIPDDPGNESHTLQGGEGLIVYAMQDKDIAFDSLLCLPLDLKNGFNFIGMSCLPDSYSAYQLLNALGSTNIMSVQRFSEDKGTFETAGLNDAGVPIGIDFPITVGEAYFVFMKQDFVGFSPK